MLFRGIFALSLLTVSTFVLADTVDFNLRNDSVQFQYFASMGTGNLGKSELHAGLLYVNQKDLLADIGIIVKDEVGKNAPGVSVGVGIKGLTAEANGNTEAAVALGGLVRYSPFPDHRLGIIGLLYFAPNIVTFGDAVRYTETGARLEYEVIPQAAAYLGYRKINFGFESGPDATVDEGAYVGLRIMF
jgi:hypothetical protein